MCLSRPRMRFRCRIIFSSARATILRPKERLRTSSLTLRPASSASSLSCTFSPAVTRTPIRSVSASPPLISNGMALAPSIGPVGGGRLFVYIVVTGPRQGRRDEPRIETRRVEERPADGGAMGRGGGGGGAGGGGGRGGGGGGWGPPGRGRFVWQLAHPVSAVWTRYESRW